MIIDEQAHRLLSMAAALLWCMVSHTVLVVVEAVRLLLTPLALRRVSVKGCEFYEGMVHHVRLSTIPNYSFSYHVRYCLVDLDAPATSYAARQLRSGARMSADEARRLSGCNGAVKVLMLPASAGYEQNPLCVYYCYDKMQSAGTGVADVEPGTLRCCIAEVTNTPWADRVAFPFDTSGDSVPKPMHVSPLQDMHSDWSLSVTKPAEALSVRVTCSAAERGTFFVATLNASRLGSSHVDDPEWWALGMAHKVVIWIYWHAAVLVGRRGLPFFGHPKAARAPHPTAEDYKAKVRAHASAAARLNGQGKAPPWQACPAFNGALAKVADPDPKAAKPPHMSMHMRDADCREEKPEPSLARPFIWTDTTAYPWD